jgi:hypothetical protein
MTSPDGPPPDRDRFSPIGPFLLAFALLDYMIPGIARHSESPIMAGLLAGTIAAQGGLLAIWAVLGPQRWIVRLPASFLAALALYGATMLGAATAHVGSAGGSDLMQILLFLPIVLLAAQVPLWIVRLVLGCRMVPAGAESAQSAKGLRQFGMEHLLGATTLIALALGLASLGLINPSTGRPYSDGWAGLSVACLLCAVWSMFSTLPCLWAAFIAKNRAGGAWALAAYTAAMTFLLLAIGSMFAGDAPPGEAVFALLAFHGALVGVMFGTLHVVRICGYVLMRAKGIKPAAAQVDSATTAEPPSPAPPADEAAGMNPAAR